MCHVPVERCPGLCCMGELSPVCSLQCVVSFATQSSPLQRQNGRKQTKLLNLSLAEKSHECSEENLKLNMGKTIIMRVRPR